MALIDNLVSYWKLDESSGPALDAHGANDLTENGTVGSETGKIITARNGFNGSGTIYLSKSDNADLSTGDIDFTFAAWMKFVSVSGARQVISKASEYGLIYEGAYANKFQFRVTGSLGEWFIESSFGAASNDTWYHVVGWHDAANNQLGISVNGGAADTTSYSYGVNDTANSFRIGYISSGSVDEVGFWKRVLTSQERTDLYNSGNGLAYPFAATGKAPPPCRRHYQQLLAH